MREDGYGLTLFNRHCGDKNPNLYTGPWALFDDIDTSEEEKMIEEAPKWRITYGKGGGI